jgi:WD40 repeat protein
MQSLNLESIRLIGLPIFYNSNFALSVTTGIRLLPIYSFHLGVYLMQFLRLLRVVTILGGLAAFNVIPGTVQAIPSGRSDLSPDPANWPVITPDNAQYLTLLGVYGHGRNTQALWGRDGHTIIVGGDRGLWLYDSRTPDAPPRALDEPDLPVRSMTISHDGRLLAVSAGHESDESDFNEAGIGGSIRIWDLTTGVLQLQVNTTPGALSFSSNDTQLIEHESYYYCCAPLDV